MKNYNDFTAIKRANKQDSQKRLNEAIKMYKDMGQDLFTNWRFRELLNKRDQKKTRTEQKKIFFAKLRQETAKQIEAFNKKCDDIARVEMCHSITIKIEWKKSHTWGYNPHCEVWSEGGYHTGRASGCGYDKRGASISEALNKDYAILKRLYCAYEKELRKPANKDKEQTANELLYYGAGYKTPRFLDIGYNSIKYLFDELGAKVNIWQEGKTWDAMQIEF